MRRAAFRRWAGAVAGCYIAVSLCHAQVRVSGRVSDENGRAVVSARVELKHLPEGAKAVALTDIAGGFQIELADAGAYALRAERPGFFAFEGKASVTAGGNQLAITLNHLQDFFQSVDVPYSAPSIDYQEPSDQKQLTSVEILEVPYPASQDVRNALPLLLGVVQDTAGRPHFNGGATDQTNFTLDGFNLSDPVTGRFDARVNIESVRSVDVESSRFAVDKGRGSAGTVDLKTAMGDDRWRFGSTNFFPGLSTEGGMHLAKWTPRFTVNGPIQKGRAWFHNGFDAFYDVDTVRGLPNGQNRARALTASNLTRLQVNLTPSNILTASVLYNYTDDTRRGLSFFDPAETTINRRQDLYFTSVRNQKYFGRGSILEIGYAYNQSFTRESPQGTETFEILPNGRRGNYFSALALHTRRQQWVTDYYAPTVEWHGTHQVRIGADAQRASFERETDRHEYRVLRGDDSVARIVTFTGNPRASRANLNLSEYAMDRWTPVTGLLVEGGVRFGWDQLVRRSLFSPRISFAWAPKWLRDTKISGGTGVFYDALNLGTLSAHQDQVSLATFYSPAGQVIRGPVETAFVVNDHELDVPRYLITSFSVERKLPFEFFGKANYMRKEGRRGLTFFSQAEAFGAVPVPEGGFYRLLNGRNDRYDAIELTLRRTFGGHFEWMGGYIRSNARSDAVVDYSLENPIFAAQGRGPLAWDAPHRWLSWGWAPVPSLPAPLRFLARDTTVAYLAEYRTGFPFSVVSEEGVLVGRPNQIRLPSYFNINLHFERRFRFMHYQWAWRLGVNNLTHNGNPNVVNNNIDSPLFLTYGRGQQRAFNVRLRFLGRR